MPYQCCVDTGVEQVIHVKGVVSIRVGHIGRVGQLARG